MTRRHVLAISGASGSIYARRAIEAILASGAELRVVISPVAVQVWDEELDTSWRSFIDEALLRWPQTLILENCRDLGASIASGSFRHHGMLVLPCSMKTLAGVAGGYSQTLIERAADVCLKERFPLVLAVRETPLNLIHLENMTRAARAGAIILPCAPAFYHGEVTVQGLVDFVVGKALDQLGVEHSLFKRWKEDPAE